ncbi:MAG TPA: D-aminoacylase [Thermoanaerobaculia bacterium]|nr:D-aminoacylase [Thermoanaerobaculia bacterium]
MTSDLTPRSFAALAAILLLSCTTTAPKPAMLDLKIINGRILDGTGAPWFRGDLGLRGDTVAAIGDLSSAPAATTIDAAGRIVSPGFIDLLGWSHYSVLEDPHLEAKVRQGVTTEVTGEGFSPGPARPGARERRWETLGDYLDLVDRQGSAINFALLMGASNARQIVIGNVNRAPTAEEMRRMEAIVEQGMRDGAIGLSTSLIYVPAMYSTTEEIIELARVAARHGGMYFTHMRDEGERIAQALEETFRIGREANIPVNIWHLKTAGRPNWGRMPEVIRRIEEARASGVDVAANVYPYPASSTNLATLVPDWAMEGGYGQLAERLRDPEQRRRIVDELRRQLARRGEKGIYIARIGNSDHSMYEKKFIEEIAAMMELPPEDALVRLYIENPTPPQTIFFSMSEDDVQYALRQPFISVGADSASPPPAVRAAGTAVHPRAYGTFARVIGHYARDLRLFTLEEAVRKMTSQAAQRAHLFDRGILRPGMKADIIVFDPDRVRDLSRFDDPHRFSEGISHVIVNGVAVLREGEMTRALPGRTLRGRGYEGR